MVGIPPIKMVMNEGWFMILLYQHYIAIVVDWDVWAMFSNLQVWQHSFPMVSLIEGTWELKRGTGQSDFVIPCLHTVCLSQTGCRSIIRNSFHVCTCTHTHLSFWVTLWDDCWLMLFYSFQQLGRTCDSRRASQRQIKYDSNTLEQMKW